MQKEAKRILEEARKDVSGERCLLRVLDALTEASSLALSQLLFAGLEDMIQNGLFSRVMLLHNVCRVASIPTLSADKAEYVGYIVGMLASSLWSDASLQDEIEKALMRVNQGTPTVLTGLMAYVEENVASISSPERDSFLQCFRLVLHSTLVGTFSSEVKQQIVSSIVRLGWFVDDQCQRAYIVRILMHAIRVIPLGNTDIISSILLAAVDLASSLEEQEVNAEVLSFLLSHLPHLYDSKTGGLHLLLALETLLKVTTDGVWKHATDLIGILAFHLSSVTSPLEQRILLRILKQVLSVGLLSKTLTRQVYVEVLFAPLLLLLPASATQLAQAQELASRAAFDNSSTPSPCVSRHYSLVHLVSTMAGDVSACLTWLQNTSVALMDATKSAHHVYHPSVMLVGLSFLFHANSSVMDEAIRFTKQCISTWPVAGRLAVPCVVYLLVQHQSSPQKLLDLLQVLIASAKDSECMKTVLKTIKALGDVSDTKPLALRLLYRVWTLETRVYPRLEEMLASEVENDPNYEWAICRLYTIYELCLARGDLGLNYIAIIQTSLEHPLPSMAAMALACVRALCLGDCLDFAAACKIIATKSRKKKIPCLEHPLFEEELCVLYGVGGSIVSDKPPFMDNLWGLTLSARDSTRLGAWKALNQYPLHIIGLKLISTVDINVESQENDEGDLERVIDQVLEAMMKEQNSEVRSTIDALLLRVGDDEAKQPRKRFIAERASGGATREMRNLLPSFKSLRQMYNDTIPLGLRQALAGAVLNSFSYSAADESLRKRKDKYIKHIESVVDDADALRQQLQSDAAVPTWSLQLALLCGWDRFMQQYVALLQEKESLLVRSTTEVAPTHSLEQATLSLIANYDMKSPNNHLALGIVARFLPSELHVLSNRIVEMLLRTLSLSMSASNSSSILQETELPQAAITALGIATQGALGLHEHRVEEVSEKIMGILGSTSDTALHDHCLLSLGHIVQSLMQQQIAPELMTRLWHYLIDHLLHATLENPSPAASSPIPPRATSFTILPSPSSTLSAVLSALTLASEGCMISQKSEWLDGLRVLLLDLHSLGYTQVLTALPPILLQCLHYELIGWSEIDSFVSLCYEHIHANSPNSDAMIALPYLLCRTIPLGHTLPSPDFTKKLLDRLETVCQDSARTFDANTRAVATLGLANLLGVGLGIDARPEAWKGMLVSRQEAERVIRCLSDLAALCPLQKVRIHASWALGTLSALGSAGDAFQIKNPGMDAGLQLPSTTLTYKLLNQLRLVKQPTALEAPWASSAFTTLTQCQIPTFHYATMVQRFLKARLGDEVAESCLAFAFRHCVQDPSLLSFLLEMTEKPRFRQLSYKLQTFFLARVPSLGKLVAPNQLHKILSNIYTASSGEVHVLHVLNAITASAIETTSTPSIAVCASVLLDEIFPPLAAGFPATDFKLWTALANAVVQVDRKQGRLRFVEALQEPSMAYASYVCLMELFRLGGCEPREVRHTLPFLSNCTNDIELLVLHIASSIRRIQPNDQLLWLMDLVNWIGLSLTRAPKEDVLLRPLLAALCLVWSPESLTQSQWLVMGHPSQVHHMVLNLPMSFPQVLLKLRSLVDEKPVNDLLAQLLVLVQQFPQGSLYEDALVYAYTVKGMQTNEPTSLISYFSNH